MVLFTLFRATQSNYDKTDYIRLEYFASVITIDCDVVQDSFPFIPLLVM